MVRYLSPEWIAALDDAARADDALAAASRGVSIVVQQEVAGGPGGDARWHVRLADGDVRVLPGAADRPDVVFHQDHATALAVARGELSAQSAFMIGKLQVRGDVSLLMAHHDLFDSVDDVFTAVRAATEY